MTGFKEIGVYVHIPFCPTKCYYCDFVSYPGRKEEEITTYLSALANEAAFYTGGVFAGGERSFLDANGKIRGKSVYIGGGTPTCLTSGQFSVLFAYLRQFVQPAEGSEITVEANPGTLQREKLACLKELGCNRLSLGVQSFSEHELQVLGRRHTTQDVFRNYALARQVGFANISVDLMYGLPGQTINAWRDNLRQAVRLRPEHLSLYQLNIEKGTPFANLAQKGVWEDVEQDEALAMYREAIRILGENGYRHYEISNFALPGHEAFHNRLYWLNEEYLGLGAGAAGFLQGVRYRNIPDIATYISCLVQGKLPVAEEERIDQELSMAETMFLGLRLREGVNREEFQRKYGVRIEEKYGRVVEKLLCQGLLQETPTQIALSEQGLYVANLVMMEFL